MIWLCFIERVFWSHEITLYRSLHEYNEIVHVPLSVDTFHAPAASIPSRPHIPDHTTHTHPHDITHSALHEDSEMVHVPLSVDTVPPLHLTPIMPLTLFTPPPQHNFMQGAA